MIIIIACAIIAALFAAACDEDPLIAASFAATFGVGMGFIASMLIGAALYTSTVPRPVDTVPLVSLADGAGVEGHFFLGSGYVDSKSVFTWYQSNGKNSFVRKSADADVTIVHYLTDDRKPYYVRSENCSADGGFFQTWALNTQTGCWDSKYDFYIPKGSIVPSYTLDNK